MKPTELLRMVQWLLLAVAFYGAAQILLSYGVAGPQQTLFWKMGHVTLGAYLGFWLDRHAFKSRVTVDSPPLEQIRRAIIMAASMYTIGAGM